MIEFEKDDQLDNKIIKKIKKENKEIYKITSQRVQ